MDNNCIFCKIINKEIPGEIIYENQHALGVLDIHPCSDGHTIVVPRLHAEFIFNVPDDEISYLFSAVKEITELLAEKLSPDGFTIGINHGAAAGQAVPHIHIHVIPRFKDDNGGSLHSIVRNASKKSLDDVKKKILS